MAKLIYATPTSLDGFLGDNNYDWSTPDQDAMTSMNEVFKTIELYLFGRKLYETMKVWDTPDIMSNLSPSSLEFAKIWQDWQKIVYSKSLDQVSIKKARLEKSFDPEAIRKLKNEISGDIGIGGGNLAEQAFKFGLVDEIHLFVVPKILGEGVPVFPKKIGINLEVRTQKQVGAWTYLQYGIKRN
jgi:dihydrofolate reductase